MFNFLDDYKHIERPVLNVIVTEFFIQLVNATFMNILPLYMSREGYSNEAIALFICVRFLGVFLLAVPMGRVIRGRRVLPLFRLSSVCVPVFSLLIVVAIHFKWTVLIYTALLLWGASFTFIQVPISPFILRNCQKQNHTAAIALSYSTWSFAGIASGVLIALLDAINPQFFSEGLVLVIFSVLGFGGIWFMRKVRISEQLEEHWKGTTKQKTNWPLVIRGLIPTLIIAVGAGLTIPFISLFFEEVHQVHKGGFSVISAIAAVLVAIGAMLVPRIKSGIGYRVAIPTTQSLAVISLVALATTQFYNQYSIALYIAIACYLLRQPLMNMAGPMTTELLLNYVGKSNREITSAIVSAIWSGSWVISGYMVKVMFAHGFHFVIIFLITSVLYALGVILYYLLIVDYNRREAAGLIET